MSEKEKFIPPDNIREAEKQAYNPIEALRRDFDDELVYYDEKGEPIIDDPDLHQIIDFYRREVKPGTLANLGAGPNHFHYISAIEERLTHITANDISAKNIQALKEFLIAFKQGKVVNNKFLDPGDIELMKCMAEVNERKDKPKDQARSAAKIFDSLYQKSTSNGQPDLIVGDMHEPETLKDRKFDNLLLGFSIFANKEQDIESLFTNLKNNLNPGGKIIISDFQGFNAGDLVGSFEEDVEVLQKFPDTIDLSPEQITAALIKAGFPREKIKAEVKEPLLESDDGEKERGYKYIFISAEL